MKNPMAFGKSVSAIVAVLSIAICSSPTALAEDDFANVVIFAENSVDMDQDSAVISGDVAVNAEDDGGVEGPDPRELIIGVQASTPSGYFVKADTIRVKQDADVDGDVFCNDISGPGSGGLTCQDPMLPAFATLPPFEEFRVDPMTVLDDVTVKVNKTKTLAAGDYGNIKVKQNGTLKLSGVYNILSLDVKLQGKVRFLGPTDIRIQGGLELDQDASMKPTGSSGAEPNEMVLYVQGEDGPNPKAADIGVQAQVKANLYVPIRNDQVRSGCGGRGSVSCARCQARCSGDGKTR